ncbi:MAG: hypothetical protein DYG98_15165 [Haliscomenobacteraceae bacterium CHB4]|nr:hypothetical protein [Haliscomenobacteraceae bacterium CHB4]
MDILHPPAPSSFFRRAWIYSREMFPLQLYLPYVLALYACLNFASQAIAGGPVVFDIYGLTGAISAFCMMLLLRTFDELKDVEIDKVLFPERALPRGDVKVSDVRILSIASFSVLLLVNLLFAPQTWLPFFIMIVYALLTFKWFFAEKIHRENLFLTMLTHQPLPLFINYYLIHTALTSGGANYSFTSDHVILLLLFSLPVTAWEVARKIRGLGKETDYVTFSRIFGPRGAALIPFIFLMFSGGFCLYAGWKLGLHSLFFLVTSVLMAFAAYFFTRFILQPTDRNNVLKNTALVFTTLLFFNMLFHLLWKYEVQWQL